MSNIVYIGDSNLNTTSRHRADALSRLGHTVCILDPYIFLNKHITNKHLSHFHYLTGYKFLQSTVCKFIDVNRIALSHADLIWMNGGELFSSRALSFLKARVSCPVVLYNNDDPTGGRDGNKFTSLLNSLHLYDHCVVMRDVNVQEYKNIGAKSVQRVWMSYDELAHLPYEDANAIPLNFRSDVLFVGTWMRGENRDEFLLKLINHGVPVSFWGQRWEMSPLWPEIKAHYRGGALGGRDYVAAIQGAKISIGLLSKGNRDLHTTRSLEIPYIGGLLLAERTTEHQFLYRENQDAVFWSDAQECVDICIDLLANQEKREAIRLAGMASVRKLHVGNEDICKSILDAIKKNNDAILSAAQ